MLSLFGLKAPLLYYKKTVISTIESNWGTYLQDELARISGLMLPLGFNLEGEQPHVGGERYLMTKNKLVLVGNRISDGVRVIIKASSHPEGKKEIISEKKSRDLLTTLAFTNDSILFPEEVFYGKVGDYLFFVTLFIHQDKVFVEHTLEEQFFLIMRTFEAQEAFHATTIEHIRLIDKTFPVFRASEYVRSYTEFAARIHQKLNDPSIDKTFSDSRALLERHTETIDAYANYLTHSDLAPHNFRIHDHSIFLLDCSAIWFGNKYEGWARFQNYMALHNPKLDQVLSEYVLKNRGEEEYLNLRLMRIYKLGFIIDYYVRSLDKTEGNLRALTEIRIPFWHKVLQSVVNSKPLDESIVREYIEKRDHLRSDAEKVRQKEFAIS